MSDYWPHLTLLGVLHAIIVVVVIPLVLMTKKESVSAIAWCLAVILMPFLGSLLFWVFGYNNVYRPIRRKREHRLAFRESYRLSIRDAERGLGGQSAATSRGFEDSAPATHPSNSTWKDLGQLALKVDAFPVSHGNQVTLYHDTAPAFASLLKAIQSARHHVHLEFFIVHSDATGERLIELLTAKAKEGVQVRLLYDAMGCLHLKGRTLRPLLEAGGKTARFLPLNPIRSRIQINMRNHRKIAVVDGRIGFTGGMNIGDEYLGKSAYFGYWRDEFLRLEGPAVAGLQRVFVEDWDFAVRESVTGDAYFPDVPATGEAAVQLIESGPDQEVNSIREMYFTAILSARQRLWIASPYFVPDSGMQDALRLAGLRGVDIRLLTLLRPDHYFSFYAGRYYWSDLLKMGAKIYQYRKGMMHSKALLVDGQWGMVGSANLDNRSLHLNFEIGCILHSPALVADMENAFQQDLEDSIPVDLETFSKRSFPARLAENACRLLSPVL